MRKLSTITCLLLALGCAPPPPSATKTDLGRDGNRRVKDTFAAYQQKASHCAGAGAGKRVLLTGFGLFSGVDYNISGAVESSFADATFTPDTLDLGTGSPAPGAQGTVSPGILTDQDEGGRVVSRTLSIDGTSYDVCFVTLDVLWDLAGAIIVEEAGRFHPDLLVMTGRGADDASFEAGAINRTDGLNGYNSDGTPAKDVTPVSDPILPHAGSSHYNLVMSWPGAALAAAAKPRIDALGYTSVAQTAAREDNDYICNNVSYVALADQAALPLDLAGGSLTGSAFPHGHIPSTAKVGFFHYPAAADDDAPHVAAWIQILATMIRTAL